MDELTRMILENYQARKTKAQKAAFEALLRERYPQLQTREHKGWPKSRNLILGDPERAEVVFTAHYDTCPRSLFPNLILPYRQTLRFLYGMVTLLPLVVLALSVAMGLAVLNADPVVTVVCAMAVYYGLFFFQFFAMPANPTTANDNTSGVITLLELYDAMTPEQRDRAAFVFFDNEEYGCVGSAQFFKENKKIMENKPVVNFDCIGDGDHFLLIRSKAVDARLEGAMRRAFVSGEGKTVVFESEKIANNSSDHKNFPVFLSVVAAHPHSFLKLYTGRIHTVRDTVLDRTNVDFLRRSSLALIEELAAAGEFS